MKNIKPNLITLLIITILSINAKCHANSNDSINRNDYQIEIRLSYNFFFHHHLEMQRFPAHFPIYELSFQKVTNGANQWETYYFYPSFGVTFLYSGLGHIGSIGEAYALYPFINFSLNKSKINQLKFRFGLGLGYLTKKYDRYENYQNTSIGSHLNAAISLNFEYRRQVTERLAMSVFAGLVHFSNGSTRVPNNGLNIVTAGLTAAYFIQTPHERIPKSPKEGRPYKGFEKNLFSYYLAFQYSFRDIDDYIGQNKNWSVYNVSFNVMKRISFLSKVGLGVDLVFDESDRVVLDKKNVAYNDIDILKPGVNAAYEIMIGQASIMAHIGFHIAGKERYDGVCYQKFSLKVNVTRHSFAMMSLTTHMAAADYIGLGVGLKIR